MRRAAAWTAAAGLAIAVILGASYVGNQLLARQAAIAHARAMTGGDPDKGKVALAAHACGGCHQAPGVAGATGKVGPPLSGMASRAYVAGRLANTPENLQRWILDPQGVDPGNAMPPTGVSPDEARDIAAYLETLQ